MKKFLTLTAVAALSFALSSCGSTSIQKSSQNTVGKELMDLNLAYQSGLITKREHDLTKKKILNRY